MVEALPAGDMHPPNKALQLEWFYMSFHKEDRAKHVKSGQRLSDKTLKSVSEYFENIYNFAGSRWLSGEEPRASRQAMHEMQDASQTVQAVQ